jgi:hypothetical protein
MRTCDRCMLFVGYMLFVSYAHEGEILLKKSSLIMAMSHAYMFLTILLAMLVLNLWQSCLFMSHF